MNLARIDEQAVNALEGTPDTMLMANTGDVDRLIEQCMGEGATAVLLYAPNLPPRFFDLASGDAGIVLQKLRNYHIRLAVVYAPQNVTLSDRFRELMLDERRGSDFGMFESRQAAVDWLRRTV
jgi:hypothetical protein